MMSGTFLVWSSSVWCCLLPSSYTRLTVSHTVSSAEGRPVGRNETEETGSRGGRNERRLRRKKRSVNGCDCKNFILDLRFRFTSLFVRPVSHPAPLVVPGLPHVNRPRPPAFTSLAPLAGSAAPAVGVMSVTRPFAARDATEPGHERRRSFTRLTVACGSVSHSLTSPLVLRSFTPYVVSLTPASLGVGLSLFTLPTRDSVTRGRLRRVG